MIRECAVCGKMFEVPNHYNKATVCSKECRDDRERQRNLERYNRLKEQRRQASVDEVIDHKIETGIKRRTKKKKITIAEIQLMAREEHLSYGQYVSKYGL